MNENESIELTNLLKAIEDYPYLRECFSAYLKWLFEECDQDRMKYDLAYFKIKTQPHTLKELENLFHKFGDILGLSENDFCKEFRFELDRNKNDILKLDDLLAEPWVALALHESGFQNIRKVLANGKKVADFTANLNSVKFAIEVKNSRNNDDQDFYKRRIDASYNTETVFLSHLRTNGKDLFEQEQEILPSRLKRKVSSEKERKDIVEKLNNTSAKENCDATMLVISVEGLSGLMDQFWVINYLEKVKVEYSVSDFFACCINGNLSCTPQLP